MWRQALLIGRRILPFVRSAAPITLALGVVVLLAATWWLGPRLEIGGEYPLAAWQMRALVTLVVVLLVAMVWAVSGVVVSLLTGDAGWGVLAAAATTMTVFSGWATRHRSQE